MRKFLLLAVASLAFAAQSGAIASDDAAAPAGARVAPGDVVPEQELAAFVDGLVRAGMLGLNVAGVEVAVVQRGRVVLQRGYGLANLDPVRPVDAQRTLFRIGSISKIFTWMLVMREVERGRLRLDAPVNDYLPDELKIPDQGFREPIRIIHLMSHAPGLASSSTGEFIADPNKILSLSDRLRVQFPPRVIEPGVISSYSDHGTELAGYIVARLNGVDFETLAEREIFTPLGLSHTTFRQPHPPREDLAAPMAQELAPDLSTGFGADGRDFTPRPFEYTLAPSGSLSTTAADMARVMLLLLNDGSIDGVKLYEASTAAAFRTPIMDVPQGVNGWAHGFSQYSLPGGFRGYGHSGGMLSFLSNMVVVPELDLGVFVTTNTNTGWGLAERIPREIVERFYVAEAAPSRPRGSDELVKNAAAYEGRFLTTMRAYSGLELFKYLLRSSGAVSVSSDGYLLAAGRKWVPEAMPARFRTLDGVNVLQFEFDESGRAASFVDDSGTSVYQRAGWTMNRELFFLLAGLTILALLAKLIGTIATIGRRCEQTRIQKTAHTIAWSAAALWLISLVAITSWATGDTLTRVYNWPGATLLTGSTAGLLAFIASLALVALLPFALRGGASEGWSSWRKIRHATLSLVFAAFGAMLAAWDALAPWSA